MSFMTVFFKKILIPDPIKDHTLHLVGLSLQPPGCEMFYPFLYFILCPSVMIWTFLTSQGRVSYRMPHNLGLSDCFLAIRVRSSIFGKNVGGGVAFLQHRIGGHKVLVPLVAGDAVWSLGQGGATSSLLCS